MKIEKYIFLDPKQTVTDRSLLLLLYYFCCYHVLLILVIVYMCQIDADLASTARPDNLEEGRRASACRGWGTPAAGGRVSPIRADAPPAARASPRGPCASSRKMTRRGGGEEGGLCQGDRAQVRAAARPQSRAGRRRCNRAFVHP